MDAPTRWDPLKTRWDPFRELEDLQKRMSTLFGRAPLRKEGGKEDLTVAEWAPLVDIMEDDKEYLIKAELPEVKKEDVKVTVQDKDGVLKIHLPKSERAKPKSVEVKVT